jgi:hypothetical protein
MAFGWSFDSGYITNGWNCECSDEMRNVEKMEMTTSRKGLTNSSGLEASTRY